MMFDNREKACIVRKARQFLISPSVDTLDSFFFIKNQECCFSGENKNKYLPAKRWILIFTLFAEELSCSE